jgi:hypothetical protein
MIYKGSWEFAIWKSMCLLHPSKIVVVLIPLQLYTDTTDTRIPLKSPRDIDVAVSTITWSILFAAGMASAPPASPKRPPAYDSLLRLEIYTKWKKQLVVSGNKHDIPFHKQRYNRVTWELKTAQWLRAKAQEADLKSLNQYDWSVWRKTRMLTKQHKSIPPLRHNNTWATTLQKVNIFSIRTIYTKSYWRSDTLLFYNL